MPADKGTRAVKAQADAAAPAYNLSAAIAALIDAASAYAASDPKTTTHSFRAHGFRVQFMGEQLSSIIAA